MEATQLNGQPSGQRPPYKPPRNVEWTACTQTGCGVNRLTAGVVWAVPVRPDLLGAHLETYIKLLPVFENLRLCHRFGRGPNVHVTRLPVEMLSSIEDYLTNEYRENAKIEWTSDFECFTGRCGYLCHVEDEVWTDEYEKASNHLFEKSYHECDVDCAPEPGYCPTVMNYMQNVLDRQTASYDDHDWSASPAMKAHGVFQAQWSERIFAKRTGQPAFFHHHQSLILEHFGLQTYATHTDTGTTVSYLVIPTKFAGSTMDRPLSWDYAHGFGVGAISAPLKVREELSAHDKARFSRAVKVLGLSDAIDKADAEVERSVGSEVHEGSEPSQSIVSVKPELTMLVRAIAEKPYGY